MKLRLSLLALALAFPLLYVAGARQGNALASILVLGALVVVCLVLLLPER